MMQTADDRERLTRLYRVKQAAAIVSVVTLGLCAAAFVVSSSTQSIQSVAEDDIRNIYGSRVISLAEKVFKNQKAAMKLRPKGTKLALIDPSQEKDLDRAIQTAFKSFALATNATVIAQATAWDPAAMEAKVAENMAEVKDIIAESGEEAKMLAKFVKPDKPGDVKIDNPGAV